MTTDSFLYQGINLNLTVDRYIRMLAIVIAFQNKLSSRSKYLHVKKMIIYSLSVQAKTNLLASVHVDNLLTLLTFHLTTPKKYTVAISRNLDLLDVVTTPTTQ